MSAHARILVYYSNSTWAFFRKIYSIYIRIFSQLIQVFSQMFEEFTNSVVIFEFLNQAFDFWNVVVRGYCNHDFIADNKKLPPHTVRAIS